MVNRQTGPGRWASSTVTLTSSAPAERLGHPLSVPTGVWWGRLSAASTWVVTLIPAAAVAVVLAGYRDRGRRRQLGVLWDVGMFWPRAFHPRAPPSYAERAVPDLQERIGRLTRERGGREGRVLLMAHSQGTVLAAAALRQVASSGAAARRRVGLVTYGAPLTRLYRRAFPAYFGDGLFAGLYEAVGTPASRWRNFYRRTDLIGGRVFTGPDNGHGDADECLRDPSTRGWPRDPSTLLAIRYMPTSPCTATSMSAARSCDMGTKYPGRPPRADESGVSGSRPGAADRGWEGPAWDHERLDLEIAPTTRGAGAGRIVP